MNRNVTRLIVTATAALLLPLTAHAACMNKFVARSEGGKKVITLLTGSLTFQEAQEVGKNVMAKKAIVSWVDDKGKEIANAAEFQAVRPMPVACGEKPSGAVINIVFLTFTSPVKSMQLKFPDGSTVKFEEQAK